jgi:hypothetical protein
MEGVSNCDKWNKKREDGLWDLTCGGLSWPSWGQFHQFHGYNSLTKEDLGETERWKMDRQHGYPISGRRAEK